MCPIHSHPCTKKTLEGFPDILRAYAKSLLKDKPKDAVSYSYEYFMNAMEQASIEKELAEEKEKEEKEAAEGAA